MRVSLQGVVDVAVSPVRVGVPIAHNSRRLSAIYIDLGLSPQLGLATFSDRTGEADESFKRSRLLQQPGVAFSGPDSLVRRHRRVFRGTVINGRARIARRRA